MQANKYRPFRPLHLTARSWPDRTLDKAPAWCSVDLRDGNQALIIPMDLEQKLAMWQLLLDIGFKEIEIGFPAASQVELEFTRHLIEQNLIPDDVHVQILCQARSHLIDASFSALQGARNVIFHVYNSTSPAQREIVFQKSKTEIIAIAVDAVKQIADQAARSGEIRLEYSPESFSSTEPDFALEICSRVMEAWGASTDRKVILNLPATVEVTMPNVYADQIEWFIQNLDNREAAIVSLHTHNDRGTGVAASELGLLAGADRVEGTLFGNGERTGNADLVTIALNMFSHGIETGLDFRQMDHIQSIYERCTGMRIPSRHPYVGELVYTAFSGSHQDAINKGLAHRQNGGAGRPWDVPYLPIDPGDLGRTYEAIIRINSQSGKGGMAYVLEQNYGYTLPRDLQVELAARIQKIADEHGTEILPRTILRTFEEEYLEHSGRFELVDFSSDTAGGRTTTTLVLKDRDQEKRIKGSGNGPIAAAVDAFAQNHLAHFKVLDYNEHALSRGSEAVACAYVLIESGETRTWGAGKDGNIALASVKALFSALNRAILVDRDG